MAAEESSHGVGASRDTGTGAENGGRAEPDDDCLFWAARAKRGAKQLASKGGGDGSCNYGSRAQAVPAMNRKQVFLPIVKGGGASDQTIG